MPAGTYNYDAGSGNTEQGNNNISANVSSNTGSMGSTAQNGDLEDARRSPFTMHGVLHFLKYEWSRYELERNEWEMERAELRARISFLVGERKAQESLKRDLVRRIKMLEYSLKQERATVHRLTHNGQDPADEEIEDFNAGPNSNVPMDVDAIDKGQTGSQDWNEARKLLRQYLQEIGYSDKILDARAFRVNSLLGILPESGINGSGKGRKAADKAMQDSEQAIIETADVIRKSRVTGDNVSDSGLVGREKANGAHDTFVGEEDSDSDNEPCGEDFPSDAVDAFSFLNDEFSFLNENSRTNTARTNDMGNVASKLNITASNNKDDFVRHDQQHGKKLLMDKLRANPTTTFKQSRSTLDAPTAGGFSGAEDVAGGDKSLCGAVSAAQPIGSLTNLSVDSALGMDAYEIDIKDNFAMADEDSRLSTQQQRYNIRYTLRSHYDAIRAMQFHPVDPVLVSASEDGTAKLWDLSNVIIGKIHNSSPSTSITENMEPIYTFRGHKGPILTMDMSPDGELCYTGGHDGSICCYAMPSAKNDVYNAYDASVLRARLIGHTDCVWSLTFHSSTNRLISASADGTIRLWEAEVAEGMQSLVRTFSTPSAADGISCVPLRPRSIDVVSTEPQQLLTAHSRAHCGILDLETAQNVLTFDFNDGSGDPVGEINKIISHPTMPVTVMAGEDGMIRVFDNNTGKIIGTMVGHTEGVSTLAIESNGLYLLSGSHDGAIRLWNVEQRRCIQDITAHRRKSNMAVMAVAFHPSRPLIASGGADSLARVYTPWDNFNSSNTCGGGNVGTNKTGAKFVAPFPVVSSPPKATSSPPMRGAVTTTSGGTGNKAPHVPPLSFSHSLNAPSITTTNFLSSTSNASPPKTNTANITTTVIDSNQ